MTPLQQRTALYAAGLVAILVLWYFAVLTPVSRDLNSARRNIDQAQHQLADYNRTVRELPEFLNTSNRLEALRRELNSSLYAKNEIMDLFRQLTDDARSHRLNLVQISPPIAELLELNRQATVDNSPLYLNLTLDLKGQYLDFGRFIGELESRPYFRAIKSCAIRGPQPDQAADMTVSFKALIGTGKAAS